MTAELAGRTAVDGFWTTLKTLKERWVLVMFLVGALVWARDVWEVYSRLPATMAEFGDRIVELSVRLSALEQGPVADHTTGPVLEFPGTAHSVADARAGDWTVLRFSPVRRIAEGCQTVALNTYMVDSAGQWHSAASALDPIPSLEADTDLAFGVRVHPRMSRGRATAVVQLVHECGPRRHLQTAPVLQFRVLGD